MTKQEEPKGKPITLVYGQSAKYEPLLLVLDDHLDEAIVIDALKKRGYNVEELKSEYGEAIVAAFGLNAEEWEREKAYWMDGEMKWCWEVEILHGEIGKSF